MSYYDDMKDWKRRVEAILKPCDIRVGHVWSVLGRCNVIWHFGKTETSMTAGATPEGAAEAVIERVFGDI